MGLAKTFLAIGIAIIFAVFISYGLSVVYEAPKYDYSSSYNNDCSKTYDCQKQIQDCQKQYDYSDPQYQDCYSNIQQSTEYKTCLEMRDKCNEEYQKQTPRYKHSRNSFYILIVIGIIAIITGIFLTGLEGIGSGLIGGGVLVVLWSLFYTYTYWFTLNKYIKLIALGIVLAILIYFGYKKIEKKLNK